MGKCAFSNCETTKVYGHHVTYRPAFVVKLCDYHHRQITVCNMNATGPWHKKLSNKKRWAVYREWLRGELRPVWTGNVGLYMAKWKVKKDQPSDSSSSTSGSK